MMKIKKLHKKKIHKLFDIHCFVKYVNIEFNKQSTWKPILKVTILLLSFSNLLLQGFGSANLSLFNDFIVKVQAVVG